MGKTAMLLTVLPLLGGCATVTSGEPSNIVLSLILTARRDLALRRAVPTSRV